MIASTLSGSICRSTVRLSAWMTVFSLMVMFVCPTSLVGPALESQGAGDDALIIDLPPDLDVEGQLDRHL